MSDAPTLPSLPSDPRADMLVAAYERAGYGRVSPGILQPAEPFLDLSGEDIRSRMFLTADAAGRELCLRPDFTIAVSRDYLASAAAGKPAQFCYLGPVFRQDEEGLGEVLQAGIESYGRRDLAAADAEMLSLALEACAHYGVAAPQLRMGDVGLFIAFIGALDLAPAWKRRLIRDFNRAGRLARDLDPLAVTDGGPRADHRGVLAALAGSDPQAARALVMDLLSIAGISAVGGRTVGEIAERFLDQAALDNGGGLTEALRALIARFLAVDGDPDEAAAALRALAAEAGIAADPGLSAALDLMESRTGFIAARGIDLSRIRFAAAFGIGVDYYTGFEFRVLDPRGDGERALVGGGRYDDLLSRLGSPTPMPAVGFGAWIGRLAAAGGVS